MKNTRQEEQSLYPVQTNETANLVSTNLFVPEGGFSWNQLAVIASQRTAESQMTALRIKRSRLENRLELAIRNPQLRWNYGFLSEDEHSPGNSNSHDNLRDSSAGLRFYINNPFVNRWIRKQADKNADSIMAAGRELSYATYCETKSSCLETAILDDRICQLQEIIEIQKKVCSRYSELNRNGFAAPLKSLKAQLRLSGLELKKNQLEREHRNALFHLSLLSGMPAGQLKVQPLGSQSLIPPSDLNMEQLITSAVQLRPDLESIRCEIEIARLEIKLAEARQIPWFDYVEGGLRNRTSNNTEYSIGGGISHSDSDRDEWMLGTAISLPVFSWTGNETALARTILEEAELRKAIAQTSLYEELKNAVENYTDAHSSHKRIQQTADKQMENFKKTLSEVDSSRTMVETDIMETEEQLNSYRLETRQSLYDCLRLKLALESLTGDRGEEK